MQMYEVTFQVHYDDIIDLGKILVCASNNDAAIEIVRFFLGIPASQATFSAVRIKPEIAKHKEARKRHDEIHSMRDLVGAISGVDNDPSPISMSPWVLGVTAGVRAASESSAWIKLGKSIIEKAHSNSAKLHKSITELDMVCEQARFRPKCSAIDKQAIYKEKSIFSGGAARPR